MDASKYQPGTKKLLEVAIKEPARTSSQFVVAESDGKNWVSSTAYGPITNINLSGYTILAVHDLPESAAVVEQDRKLAERIIMAIYGHGLDIHECIRVATYEITRFRSQHPSIPR